MHAVGLPLCKPHLVRLPPECGERIIAYLGNPLPLRYVASSMEDLFRYVFEQDETNRRIIQEIRRVLIPIETLMVQERGVLRSLVLRMGNLIGRVRYFFMFWFSNLRGHLSLSTRSLRQSGPSMLDEILGILPNWLEYLREREEKVPFLTNIFLKSSEVYGDHLLSHEKLFNLEGWIRGLGSIIRVKEMISIDLDELKACYLAPRGDFDVENMAQRECDPKRVWGWMAAGQSHLEVDHMRALNSSFTMIHFVVQIDRYLERLKNRLHGYWSERKRELIFRKEEWGSQYDIRAREYYLVAVMIWLVSSLSNDQERLSLARLLWEQCVQPFAYLRLSLGDHVLFALANG